MYICPRWVDNLTHDHNDSDIDDTFSEIACNSFAESANAYVNRDGEVQEYTSDETGEAYCYDHDEYVRWDRGSIRDQAEEAGWYICECDQMYDNDENYNSHRADEHGDETPTIFPAPTPPMGAYIATTTRRSWTAQPVVQSYQ